MVQIRQITQDEFDWTSEDGPAAEVRRIARASTAHDGADTLNEQAVLQLKNRGVRDAELWLGAGGFALLHGDILDLAVHPESRRLGVGTALARAILEDVTTSVNAWSHSDHPGAAGIARSIGLPKERELKIMRRSTSTPLGDVVVPDGVRIRTFRVGDEEALLAVNAHAFATHPEQGHLSLDDFRERVSEPWFEAEGLFLAVPENPEAAADAHEPVLLGFHWTKVHVDEDPVYGEVYVVAVNPKAAGRGLGTVLTNVGLQHLRDRGLESVILYVDGDNDAAIAVYTGQGFELARAEVQYRGVPRFEA